MQQSDDVDREDVIANGVDPNNEATVAGEEGMKRRPIKFAYASGSQPLTGFTIKRGVGFGGFGDVYYATSDAGKEVALKRIQRNLDVELRGVRQCLNLKHPNLVSLFDIRYDDEGQAWVVMEYVAGDSLQDVIERNPNGMPIEEVAKWFNGLADGVAYLHDNGIVHRDLKPGNIFIDSQLVKIGDYGLAKFISCSRRSGQTESVGTFHYMAPEIGLGRYGKEIDIYAMGVMLFEMLTGRVPYEGESSQEIIMKHLTAEPDLSMLVEPYRSVVAKALNKDPDKRYRNVMDMANDLGHATGQSTPNHTRRVSAKDTPVMAQVVSPASPARAMPEEPIAAAVKDLMAKVNAKWNSPEINMPAKMCFVGCFALIMLSIGAPIMSLAFLGAIVYAIYYVVWYLLNASSETSSQAAKQSFVVAEKSQPLKPKPTRRKVRRLKQVTRQQIADEVRKSLGKQSGLQKARDLTGSMLMAVVVSGVVCVLTLLIGIQNMETTIYSWGPTYAWMTISSVVAAWTVLFFSKFWERTAGDQALRRFCMLTAGLAVGATSFFVADGLMLKPTYVLSGIEGPFELTSIPVLYTEHGAPQLLAFMGYFGALFVLMRLWLNADPLRSSRLRFFSTLVVIVAGILMQTVLPIPKGFLIAATAVIAVQLSSPWIDSVQRQRVKNQLEQRQLETIG
ncbi:protein kinase [Planctomycetota bacterium]